jgi:hypothetical protein
VDAENQKCAYIIHSFSNVRRLNANVVTQKDGFPLQLHVISERSYYIISQALLLAIRGMLTYY